jgi:hypothetical protein
MSVPDEYVKPVTTLQISPSGNNSMKIFTAACLATLLSVAPSVVPASAKPIPKFLKANQPYAPFRAKLLKQGWVPAGKAMRETGSCLEEYDTRCVDFPEARECSGTGLGFCNMVWKHRDGSIIVINTAGEDAPAIVVTTGE